MSGSIAQGAAAGPKNDAARAIAERIIGVCLTNRMPARIAPTRCSRGSELRTGLRRQLSSAAITARYDTALQQKASCGPPNSTRKPASAGPTARAMLKPTPFSAIACTRSERGTTSAMTEPQAGCSSPSRGRS